MASLTTTARALARSSAPRTAVRCLSSTAVRTEGASSSYESPFKGAQSTTNVPDFGHYAAKNSPNKNLLYQYFMVGAMGAVTGAGAKSTIQGERPPGTGRRREGEVDGEHARGTEGSIGPPRVGIEALRMIDVETGADKRGGQNS